MSHFFEIYLFVACEVDYIGVGNVGKFTAFCGEKDLGYILVENCNRVGFVTRVSCVWLVLVIRKMLTEDNVVVLKTL